MLKKRSETRHNKHSAPEAPSSPTSSTPKDRGNAVAADADDSSGVSCSGWQDIQVLLKREALLLSKLQTELQTTKQHSTQLNVILRELLSLDSFAERFRREFDSSGSLPAQAKEFLLHKMENLGKIQKIAASDSQNLDSNGGEDNNNNNQSSRSNNPLTEGIAITTDFDFLRKERSYLKLLSLLRNNRDILIELLLVTWQTAERSALMELVMFSLFGVWRHPFEERLRLQFLREACLSDKRDSIGSKILTIYTRFIGGRRFLNMCFKSTLRTVAYSERLDFEYDESKVLTEIQQRMGDANPELLKFAAKEIASKNHIHLNFYTAKLLQHIDKYVLSLPFGLLWIIRELFRADQHDKFFKFFFYSYMIPAIVHPETFGLFLEDQITEKTRRNLLLIGKEIQRAVQRLGEEMQSGRRGTSSGTGDGLDEANNRNTSPPPKSPSSGNANKHLSSSSLQQPQRSDKIDQALRSIMAKLEGSNIPELDETVDKINSIERFFPRAIVLLEREVFFLHKVVFDYCVQYSQTSTKSGEGSHKRTTSASVSPKVTATLSAQRVKQMQEIIDELGPTPPHVAGFDSDDDSAGPLLLEEDQKYLVYFSDDNNTLHKSYNEIDFPTLQSYGQATANKQICRLLEKVHVALIKVALLQRTDNLSLLEVFNRTKQAAMFNDNLPLATCINEVICALQKSQGSGDAQSDPNSKDVLSLLFQQWKNRAPERKALRERIEAVSMFHHSIENEVSQQLMTKHHIASTFFVRAVISTNEDLIIKFVHSLSVIPEPSGASKVPFWVRTFLTKNEQVLLLLERKRHFTQFVNTVIEKQRQLEPRTPASALISIERYLHSRVYNSFLLNVKEDEELLSVMTSHQPKSFSHWWIDPVFEDSKKPFDGDVGDSSLKVAVKVFKEMLVLRNPYDKFKCLLRLRNIIVQLFTICGVEISSDSISKTLRFIMWRAKPSQLLANMQYIFLFLDSPSGTDGEPSQSNNILGESVELGSENEKVSSDFEFCVKALLMIAEELPRR